MYCTVSYIAHFRNSESLCRIPFNIFHLACGVLRWSAASCGVLLRPAASCGFQGDRLGFVIFRSKKSADLHVRILPVAGSIVAHTHITVRINHAPAGV